MAGLETYIDAVVATIEANKVALGVVTVYDEIDYENDIGRTSASFPIILVDGQTLDRQQDDQLYKTFGLTIVILVEAEQQTPVKYNTARQTAAAIESALGDNYLRHISGFEEPDSISSEFGPMRLESRKFYAIVMTVINRTPFNG